MKIFSGGANHGLALEIAESLHAELSPIEIFTFPDGERRVRLNEPVAGEDCIVVQPTSPPVDQNSMELFLMLDAVKRSGADKIIAVVPYLGYQRQDHVFREGEARSLELVIRLIEAAGATQFIGVDFHSVKIPELFHIDVSELSVLSLFADKIRSIKTDLSVACLVSPDMGGLRRLDLLSNILPGMECVSVEKDRDLATGDIKVSGIHGNVKKTCFIIDDMISSGGTIIQALDALDKEGAEEMYVMATHAVFSADAPKLLEDSKAVKVYVTNSIEITPEKHFHKLEVLSVGKLIADSILESK